MTLAWYNSNYLLRRGIQITSPDGAPAGHFVTFILQDASKSLQPDQADIMVVYSPNASVSTGLDYSQLGYGSDSYGGDQQSQVLPRSVTHKADGTLAVQFNLVNPLQPNAPDSGFYYVYEACPIATNVIKAPGTGINYSQLGYGASNYGGIGSTTYNYSPWPVSEDIYGPNISYTRPGDHWIAGVASAVGAMARISFYGTAIQVESNVGSQQGTMQVQLDAQTPEIVDLYAVTPSQQVVYQATGLPGGYHTVTLQATGQANPASSGTAINIVGYNAVKYLIVQDQGEEISSLVWSSHVGGV